MNWTPMKKSKQKKQAGKRHARNFGTGYIKIEEYHLLRTGLRGRKRWLLLCGATLLSLIAIGNLILNILLLVVLGLRPTGLPYMVSQSNNKLVFPLSFNTTSTEVMKGIFSYWNTSLLITSQHSSVAISGGPIRTQVSPAGSSSSQSFLNASRVTLEQKYMQFQPYESWSLYDSSGNHSLLMSINETSSVFTNEVSLMNDLNTTSIVSATNVYTDDIVSDHTRLVSYETLSIDKDDINIQANGDIKMTVGDPNGHLIFNSRQSVIFSDLPSLQSTDSYHGDDLIDNYHICMCGNSGKIFRVPQSCSLVNEIINPCQ